MVRLPNLNPDVDSSVRTGGFCTQAWCPSPGCVLPMAGMCFLTIRTTGMPLKCLTVRGKFSAASHLGQLQYLEFLDLTQPLKYISGLCDKWFIFNT